MFGVAGRLEADGVVYRPGWYGRADGNVFPGRLDGFLRKKCAAVSGGYHADDGGQIWCCADHLRMQSGGGQAFLFPKVLYTGVLKGKKAQGKQIRGKGMLGPYMGKSKMADILPKRLLLPGTGGQGTAVDKKKSICLSGLQGTKSFLFPAGGQLYLNVLIQGGQYSFLEPLKVSWWGAEAQTPLFLLLDFFDLFSGLGFGVENGAGGVEKDDALFRRQKRPPLFLKQLDLQLLLCPGQVVG